MKTTVAISILNRAYDFFEYRNSCTDSALAGKNKNYREIYPDSALFGANSALAREMAAKYHDTDVSSTHKLRPYTFFKNIYCS
jgi:hypothetical protein